MAQWQRYLDIKDVWDSQNIQLIAKSLSEQLSKLEPIADEQLDSTRNWLAEQFLEIANDDTATTFEFDCVMDHLYDWADTRLDSNLNGKKVCWVATF